MGFPPTSMCTYSPGCTTASRVSSTTHAPRSGATLVATPSSCPYSLTPQHATRSGAPAMAVD
eukprot:958796-Rhodomonas_salina.1